MLDADSKAFLLDILNTPSPTGFEFRGQKKWVDYTRHYADAVQNDAYGNAWATLTGEGKKPRRIMLEAHADEVQPLTDRISRGLERCQLDPAVAAAMERMPTF